MTPRYVPRDYQAAGTDAVFDHFGRVRSTLLVWATGVGKTEAYLQVVDRFLRENPTRPGGRPPRGAGQSAGEALAPRPRRMARDRDGRAARRGRRRRPVRER